MIRGACVWCYRRVQVRRWIRELRRQYVLHEIAKYYQPCLTFTTGDAVQAIKPWAVDTVYGYGVIVTVDGFEIDGDCLPNSYRVRFAEWPHTLVWMAGSELQYDRRTMR
jgi:hypothetical protein